MFFEFFVMQTTCSIIIHTKNKTLKEFDTPLGFLSLQPYRLYYKKAVWTGLEPATLAVTGRYSNQLNYQTVF